MFVMNDDAITDLKQFITATVSQQSTGLREDIVNTLRKDIKQLDDTLSSKIDDLSTSVTEALENHGDATETQLHDHEQRIRNLETKIV